MNLKLKWQELFRRKRFEHEILKIVGEDVDTFSYIYNTNQERFENLRDVIIYKAVVENGYEGKELQAFRNGVDSIINTLAESKHYMDSKRIEDNAESKQTRF